MFKLFFLPFRMAIGFVKLAGIWGTLLFAVGVVVGLLIAPTSGARLRAKLQARLDAARSAAGPTPETATAH